MNSDKQCAGNVVIYVLVALALLALLSTTIANQDTGSESEIDQDKVILLASDVLAYAGSVRTVVDNMVMAGTEEASIDFIAPYQTAFSTAPYENKIYHPQGGGLAVPAIRPDLFSYGGVEPKAGFYVSMHNNVQWTPTTAPDVLMTAFGISQAVCAALNKKITGSTAIPAMAASGNIGRFLVKGDISTLPDENLTVAACPACEGYAALCVSNSAANMWAYYNIISGR